MESVSYEKGATICTCLCECGVRKEIDASNLRSGATQSCGCLRRELTIERNGSEGIKAQRRTHGMVGTAEYVAWQDMKTRCLNPNDISFKGYGARGIGICEGLMDPVVFLNLLGLKPAADYSLDRTNNDWGYWCGECLQCATNRWPRNVQWATVIHQNNNRRNSPKPPLNYAVIVDFSHLFHQCFSVAGSAGPTYDLIETTAYHAQGVLRTLQKTLDKLKISDYDLVFVEDRIAVRKNSLLPNYRAGRVSRHLDKMRVKEILRAKGVDGYWCHSPDNEADDTIATLVRLSTSKKVFTVIVTGDRDLWQLISPTTAVFHPTRKELISLEDIHKAFAVGPNHVALVKALWGDAGDCVPNAMPRTQRHLLPILRQSQGSFEEFEKLLESHWQTLTPRCREIATAGMSQARLNWQLVRLDENCPLSWD